MLYRDPLVFFLMKQDKSQEAEHYWLLPTTYPLTKTKPRTLDMTVDYKVSSFLLLHSDFWYTCHYLLVDTNVSQSASPSKLKVSVRRQPDIASLE